jgi:hypothetical protein
MKVLTLNIPGNLDLDNTQVAMPVASRLCEQDKLFLGQAAELGGPAKRTFAELPASHDVSIFKHPASDISGDILNVK